MKPEKILAKKFVRGKPYYKIKWGGVGKDQATWETPPNLENYKKMINEYEVKNWGTPLNAQFFDPEIYLNKGFAHRSKMLSKKKIVKKLNKKRNKKFEEPASQEESSESQQKVYPSIALSSEQESSQIQNNIQKKGIYRQERGHKARNSNKKILADKNKEAEVLVIESSEEEEVNVSQRNIISQNFNKNQTILGQKTSQKFMIEQIEQNQSQIEYQSQDQEAQIDIFQKERDYGLCLPSLEQTEQTQPKKKLNFKKTLDIEIEPTRPKQNISRIYHLEKISIQNHLYLVQYENHVMKKLTSSELMDWHHKEFISYLESVIRRNFDI